MRGNLYVISAPSGAGKTTLVKALIESMSNITVSISYTTRPSRSKEINGINYYFIDEAEFRQMIKNAAFLEYALVFNHYYGTSKAWVEQTLMKGIDVILEIDWQGYQQIKHIFPECIGVFILPPSFEALQSRLCLRNQDKQAILTERLADITTVTSHLPEYDYIVFNDHFDIALNDLKIIVQAGYLLQRNQAIKHRQLIHDLQTASFHA